MEQREKSIHFIEQLNLLLILDVKTRKNKTEGILFSSAGIFGIVKISTTKKIGGYIMLRTKLIKLGVVSASSLLLLAACGDGGTGTETPPAEEPTVTDTTQDTTQTDTTAPATEDTTADTAQDTSQEGGAVGENQPTGNTQQGINNMDFATSLDDAIQMFNDEFNNPNIESIQFDEDDGRYTYEFEGFDETNDYEAEIDAQSGEFFQREQESDSDMDDDVLDLEGIITPEEAMSAALEHTGSGYVESWELDVENGITVYEIDVEDTDGVFDEDIDVNAQTGEIVNN